MKKRALAAVFAAGLLGLGAWFLWGPPGESAAPVHNPARDLPFDAAGELSALAKAALPAARGTLSIRGKVVSAEGPVGGAVVVATGGAGNDLPGEPLCDGQEDCRTFQHGCGCGEQSRRAAEAVATRLGEQPPVARATSGPDGSYELVGLDEGPWSLWGSHPGAGSGLRVGVPGGRTDVELTLTAGRLLTGRVQGPGYKPIAGAVVTAILLSSHRFFEAQSDAAGSFRIGPLPQGEYLLVATKDGLLPNHAHVREGSGVDRTLVLSTPRRLAGHVVRGGKPVADATVLLDVNAPAPKAVTGADGAFVFNGVCPADYEMSATLDREVALRGVTVDPDMDEPDAELELSPSGTVEGAVTDEGGSPIVGASVAGYFPGGAGLVRTIKTDASGRYRYDALPVGSYKMRASADGYMGDDSPHASDDDVKVTADAVLKLDFQLSRGSTVTGVVVDPKGRPFAGAKVIARRLKGTAAGPPVFGAEWTTKEDGRFELLKLRPGRYLIQALHPDCQAGEQAVDAPAEGVRLELKPGTAVTGWVLDETGLPQSNAVVRLVPDVTFWLSTGPPTIMDDIATVHTDARGSFKFGGVASGRYALLATPDEDDRGHTARRGVKRVEVAGLTPVTVEIAYEPGHAISGIVLDTGGRPVADAAVEATEAERFPLKLKLSLLELFDFKPGKGAAHSRPDGTFSVEHLAAGTWRLSATKGRAGGERTEASAGAEGVKLTLHTLTHLRGKVRTAQGQPVTDFAVNGDTQHSADGTFDYQSTEKGLDQVRVESRGYAVAERLVRFTEGIDQALEDFVLTRGRTVSLTVVNDATGEPVGGALVGTDDRDYQLGRIGQGYGENVVRTGPDGRASLSRVDDGLAVVPVLAKGFVGYEAQLPAGQREATVRLDPGSKMVGTVLDPSGNPPESASLYAQPQDQESLPRGDQREAACRAKADGSFELAGLSPNRYRVRVFASSPGGERSELTRDVEVGAHATVRVDFKVENSGAALEVRVLDPEGDEALAFLLLAPGSVAMPGSSSEFSDLKRVAVEPRGDPDGVHYVFRSLAAGKYTLFLCQPVGDGIAIQKQPVEVRESGTQKLEVRLESNRTVLKGRP